jgi:hypothetical protein
MSKTAGSSRGKPVPQPVKQNAAHQMTRIA